MILSTIPLAPLTTLKVGGAADFFVSVHTITELEEALAYKEEHNLSIHILGGGSNTLFLDSGFRGLVIHIALKGIEERHTENTYSFKVAAGEVWDDVVAYVGSVGAVGFENLSLIPGSVGGAVVQNIGAYGRELAPFVKEVEVYDQKTKKVVVRTREACEFGYRESLFKQSEGERYIVISVVFELLKTNTVTCEYPDVKKYLEVQGIDTGVVTHKELREAVIAIRKEKLPSLIDWGTAGSFFKNPIVTNEAALTLKEKYPDLPLWREGEGYAKLSAAYLIDKVALSKAFTVGGAFVWHKQALVITTKEGATSDDVLSLKAKIQQEVLKRSGVALEEEVVIVF